MAGETSHPSPLNDGYGEEDINDLLARFERWNHAVALDAVPRGHADYEDVVQEARIAMWKASKKVDPQQGPVHATWVTKAARWRINDVRQRETWTGHTHVRGKAPDALRKPHSNVDDALLDGNPEVLEAITAPDALDVVLLNYHYGQIAQAVASLKPAHRAYVVQRFWHGKTDAEIAAEAAESDSALRWRWTHQIKPTLQTALHDLESMAA